MGNTFKEDNRPSMQFYPDDWVSESGLRLCSLEARGLWMEMICIMFKAQIRGNLTVNSKQIQSKQLAKIVGADEQTVEKCIEELETWQIFSRHDDNTIYCRRMFNEASKKRQISEARSEAGRKGGKSKSLSKEESKNEAKQASPTPSPSPSPSPTPKSKALSENINLIFEHWNSKNLIKHQKLTDRMRNSIKTRLKDYSVEEIIKAIDRYDKILNSKEYKLNYRWTIELFLSQKNGIPAFNHEYCFTNWRIGKKEDSQRNLEHKPLSTFNNFGEFIDYFEPYHKKGTEKLLPYPKQIKELAYNFILGHIRLEDAVKKWEEK